MDLLSLCAIYASGIAATLHFTFNSVTGRSEPNEVGTHIVKQVPLIDPIKVLMPPLHIKLGLIKLFVNRLDPESDAFQHIQSMFPKLSIAKVKAGVFVGPQVRRLINSETFPEKLTQLQRAAWSSFVAVVCGFLGNRKAVSLTTLRNRENDSTRTSKLLRSVIKVSAMKV